MDYAACNIVYVDRTALEDKLVRREDVVTNVSTLENSATATDGAITPRAISAVDNNVNILLGSFTEVHVCTSGKSCISKISELNRASTADLIPTLVLIDIPYDDQIIERPAREVRTPSPSSKPQIDGILDGDIVEAYGIKLLQWIASELQQHRLSKLIVPVAMVASASEQGLSVNSSSKNRMSSKSEPAPAGYEIGRQNRKSSGIYIPLDQRRTMRFLDIGAVDVITSPLLLERLPSLAVHAYRAHKDASRDHRAFLEMKRGRKRSWVGVEDQKPYAYLREAMVSRLMEGICTLNSEEVEEYGQWRVSVSLDRREAIAHAISSWQFSAHDFEDDELLYASSLMFQHALSLPELEKWRISTENLTAFLITSREAYNSFVPYHNFRHVVDVLQAIFHFLVRLGNLPEYPPRPDGTTRRSSPIAELIRPFDALTLMITAIGHDVGHPGVNNAFLVHLNAPLAQLYNDRSVLESFHCAAYSQILRRHWLAAFEERGMRQLMISTILATDMGLHFDYMKKLGYLQEKLHENGGVTDGWNGRTIEDQRTLACSLLIKCADISNVARRFDTATRWTEILTDEFARQASMEQDLGIPTALYAPPVREIVELGKSQIGFMNMFAIPLFGGVTDVMPSMGFCVEELERNKAAWESRIAIEQEKMRQDGFLGLPDGLQSGMRSPRTMSIAQPSQDGSASQDVTSRYNEASNIRVQPRLNRNPFMIRQGSNDESPKGTKQGIEFPLSAASPDRRLSKPSQLQLSFATSIAPGLLDHPNQDVEILANGDRRVNGVHVQPSLSTDVVVVGPPTPKELSLPHHQRSSETTTEGSNSGSAGEWSAGATTNNKSPLAPSTQATSFASEDSNNDRAVTPTHASPLVNSTSHSSVGYDRSSHSTNDGSSVPEAGSDLKVLAETGRNLKKKPSRFRMNGLHFWKRKNGNPPMPAGTPDKRDSDGTEG